MKFIDRDPQWYTRRVKEAIQDLIPITSIGIAESTFPKLGYPRSNNTRDDLGGPMREHHPNAPIAAYQRATNSDT